MKALFAIANGFEDLDFFVPYFRLLEAGVDVTVVSAVDNVPAVGLHGYAVEPDMPIPEVNPSDYELLVIPGGRAPEALRLREEAVDLARTFMQDGQMVAAIGHGPQLLISAQALDSRILTCSPSIRDDVRAADAAYRDESLVIDANLVTIPATEHLPELCETLVDLLAARAR